MSVHKFKRIWVFWGKSSSFQIPHLHCYSSITCSHPVQRLQNSIDLPTNSFLTFIIFNGGDNLPYWFLISDTVYWNITILHICLCFVLICVNVYIVLYQFVNIFFITDMRACRPEMMYCLPQVRMISCGSWPSADISKTFGS